MKIILLPEGLASRIAAGEVVERPASAVKELVENALDAGASEISVWVEGSGISLIRVSDDGEGIASEDLPLAVERHSTSKLKSEEELFRIATLGFRGEALPSIASVSKLEIVSRIRREEVGTRLRVEGGKKGEPVAAGAPAGTTVEVRGLFYNTPARRKFLKSPATELGHICDVLNRMALAYPEVHWRLHHSGRILMDYVAVSRLEDRLPQVLGADIAGFMSPFFWERGKTTIHGFLSAAPHSFSSSRYLWTFVNRRFVRDRILIHAILQGYETLLMKGRYPGVVFYLEIPYHEVDVNVHPAKYEVRFRRQTEIHEAVTEAVREGLRDKARGIRPSVDEQRTEASPRVEEASLPYSGRAGGGALDSSLFGLVAEKATGEQRRPGFFSSLEILGQLLECYLVCASSRGLVLIDQHAAHERVAFERMRHQLETEEVATQQLLIPQHLEVPAAEAVLLGQRLGVLERLGFTIEPFGPRTFAIKAVPALLPPGDYREAVLRMVGELAEVGKSGELRHDLEERLMTIACHSVIRASRRLNKEEMRALLADLDGIDFATQCPHGRPVLFELTEEQLERLFKRA